MLTRRELLRGLALGGAVIAGELWIPGKKLISIPKLPKFTPTWTSYTGPAYLAGDLGRPGGDNSRWVKAWYADGKLHVQDVTNEIYSSRDGGEFTNPNGEAYMRALLESMKQTRDDVTKRYFATFDLDHYDA